MPTGPSWPPLRGRDAPPEQQIRRWMRSPAVTVCLTAPLSDALFLMREHNLRHLPVVRDSGELCGLIAPSDIHSTALQRASGRTTVDIADALRRVGVYAAVHGRPPAVTPETSLRDAARLMLDHKLASLPVIDEYRNVVGTIHERDLFEALVRRLGLAAA